MWLLANVLVHPETRGCIIPCPEDKNWHGQARTSCDYQHQLYRSRLNKTIIMIIDHHDHWSSRSSPYLTSSAAISPPSWHWHGQARTFCHHKHKLYRSPSRLSWSSFWSSSSYLHDHLNYHHQRQVLYRSPTINHHNHPDRQHRCHHYHHRAMITLDRINYFKLQSSPTPTVQVTSKIYDFKLVEQVMVTSC